MVKGGSLENEGQVVVFTGAGKGKTTAALGLACRAVGHGRTAAFIHFTGPERPQLGDVAATRRFTASLTMIGIECQAGDPSYLNDFDESVSTLEAALDRAKRLLVEEKCDVLVLDDINPLLHQGIVEEASIVDLINDRPEGSTIVLTGRFAPEAILRMADVVTDFAEVKHPAQAGIEPRKGIDF
jgi:cob(I)alamin adenosyltransferase